MVASVFEIVKVPVVAEENVAVDKSVQVRLSPEPCSLKVLVAALDKAQLTKSKLIPEIAM